MKNYTQLTQDQQYQIYALMKAGHSQIEIATIVDAHKSSVNRELRRNRGLQCHRRSARRSDFLTESAISFSLSHHLL